MEAKQAHRSLAVALESNIADVLPELVHRHVIPDIATDQTTPDPLRGYFPPASRFTKRWRCAAAVRTRSKAGARIR